MVFAQRLFALALYFLALEAAHASGQGEGISAPSLEELMAKVRQTQTLKALVEEERHFKIRPQPIRQRGSILFKRGQILFSEFSGSIKQPTLVRFDERGRPVVKKREGAHSARFIAAFLSGDLNDLEEHFKITYLPGDDGSWKLLLAPRGNVVRKHLEAVEIQGSMHALRSVEVRLPSGTRTVIHILSETREVEITEAEVRRLIAEYGG